ncbi:hypothetical protein D3C83_140030 [compost metagenome]
MPSFMKLVAGGPTPTYWITWFDSCASRPNVVSSGGLTIARAASVLMYAVPERSNPTGSPASPALL